MQDGRLLASGNVLWSPSLHPSFAITVTLTNLLLSSTKHGRAQCMECMIRYSDDHKNYLPFIPFCWSVPYGIAFIHNPYQWILATQHPVDRLAGTHHGWLWAPHKAYHSGDALIQSSDYPCQSHADFYPWPFLPHSICRLQVQNVSI